MRTVLSLLALALVFGCESDTSTSTAADSGTTTAPDSQPAEDDASNGEQVADAGSSDLDTESAPDGACAPDAAKACKAAGKGCLADTTGDRCEQCPLGQHPDGEFAQCAAIPGQKLSYDFGELVLDSGQELNGWCQQWRLNNPEPIWVNAVEFDTDGGYHHSNWFFVPADSPTGQSYPEGLWKKCYNSGFDELEAALAGGVLFAQSTQVDRETQKFRAGAAVRVPPNAIIIGATHLLNVEPNEKTTGLRMNLYTVPEAEVDTRLLPMRLSYVDLAIPPLGNAEFSSTCNFREAYESQTGRTFDAKLHYVLPHYHSLGTGFELSLVGGELDGTTLVEDQKFSSDPFGRLFDPPIDLGKTDGFHFACRYQNYFNKTIVWGIGDNEMCVMLGFIESDRAFDATVLSSSTQENVDGVLQVSGGCTVFSLDLGQESD